MPDEKTEEEIENEKKTALEEYEELLKKKQGLEEENRKLLDSITKTREERRTFETEKVVEKEVQEEEELSTQEGWLKAIDKKSSDAVKPVVSELEKLKDTQRSKAFKLFIKNHPDYAISSDPNDVRLKELQSTYDRIKTRTEYDSDDISEDLEDAWAVLNRKIIYEKSETIRKQKLETEYGVSEIAASGGSYEKSVPENLNATQSDLKIAHSIGMDIKKYMELKKQAEELEI